MLTDYLLSAWDDNKLLTYKHLYLINQIEVEKRSPLNEQFFQIGLQGWKQRHISDDTPALHIPKHCLRKHNANIIFLVHHHTL
jgi:hypothetical protein